MVYYNIFENIHKQLINKYLNEVNKDINKLYTDTTFINNLYGKKTKFLIRLKNVC